MKAKMWIDHAARVTLNAALGERRCVELERTCPGALAFAYGLAQRSGHAEIAAALASDLRLSRPLHRALGVAISRWIDAVCVQTLFHDAHRERWQWMRRTSDRTRHSVVDAHRLLVRRAPITVGPLSLLRAPWLAVVPEDIPLDATLARDWYDLVSALAPGPREPREDEPARSITKWLSASALDALALGREALVDRDSLRDVVGAMLDARSCVPRDVGVMKPVGRFLYTFRPAATRPDVDVLEELATELGVDSNEVRDLALPRPPVASGDGIEVRYLDTVSDVLHEGTRMRNCLSWMPANYLPARQWVVGVTIDGTPLTVGLREHSNGRLMLTDAVQRANVPASAEQRAAIEGWLEGMTRKHIQYLATF